MTKSTYHIFFGNLANSIKMDIILCLREKQRNVGEIVKCLNVEQSKVSHALRSLKDCKIVTSKREGKQITYSLNKDTIVPILKLIDKHASKHCKCSSCASLNCGRRK